MNIIQSPIRLFAIALIMFVSVECAGVASAQTLFPDPVVSDPTDSSIDQSRVVGRRGLLFRFKFFNASDREKDDEGFPLDLSMAQAPLTIGVGAPLHCAPGLSPAPNDCSFTIVDGPDNDSHLDMVEILVEFDGRQVFSRRLSELNIPVK
jgi:hypothetical protein